MASLCRTQPLIQTERERERECFLRHNSSRPAFTVWWKSGANVKSSNPGHPPWPRSFGREACGWADREERSRRRGGSRSLKYRLGDR